MGEDFRKLFIELCRSTAVLAETVMDYDKKNKCLITVERNYFKPGDIVEIFTPTGETYDYVIDKIYDEDMNELDVARHPEEIIKLPFDKQLEEVHIKLDLEE